MLHSEVADFAASCFSGFQVDLKMWPNLGPVSQDLGHMLNPRSLELSHHTVSRKGRNKSWQP